MKLEETINQSSDYTTNLQSSRQYGTGTKTEVQTYGTREPRGKPTHLLGTLFLAMEIRIYNGAKTDSSVNGAGKTGELHVKE